MNHEETRERMSEWLDGELDPAARAAMSIHIDSCAECRVAVVRLRRMGAALYGTPAAADPRSTEAFVARVMARVDAESVGVWERLAARFLTPALGLALAGLLLSIAMPRADSDAPLGVAMSVDADAVLGVTP